MIWKFWVFNLSINDHLDMITVMLFVTVLTAIGIQTLHLFGAWLSIIVGLCLQTVETGLYLFKLRIFQMNRRSHT